MIVQRSQTSCPLDCPDTCELDVVVEGGRITQIGPAARSGPDAFICAKVRRFERRVYHETRLKTPLRRTGIKGEGQFEPISWDDALDEIACRFADIRDRWGSEAILPYHYGGSNGSMTDGFIDSAFFARLGASRLAKTICAAPSTAVATGMYGKMPGVSYDDYPMARCIIVWGTNPKATSIHLVPQLREARENGAFLAVIDPRRSFSASEVDLFLPVRPGTDLPLALGMIRLWRHAGALDTEFLESNAVDATVLIERAEAWPLDRTAETTGLDRADIELLAARYQSASPAVIRAGWGVERNRNGGQALAAILAMPALLGKFGVRGGGYTMSNSGGARSTVGELVGADRWDTRTLNMTQLGMLLNESLDPPIKGLFVYNCNPAVTVPDQRAVMRGLSREDLFTVVSEQVHTDTVDFADIVLPATTFLEHHDVRVAYGSYRVAGIRPVIAPEGEARANPHVFAALGRRMGFTGSPFDLDPDSYVDVVAGAITAAGRPIRVERIRDGRADPYDFDGAAPVQFRTVSPATADGKVHLAPEQLGPEPYVFHPVTDDRYPLALISPASHRMITSTLGEFNYAELTVTIHPADAVARGVAHGDVVRVFNDLGTVECPAAVDERVRPGVALMPKGAWRKSSRNGMTSTALCPPTVNVVGGGACFNDARVEVARA